MKSRQRLLLLAVNALVSVVPMTVLAQATPDFIRKYEKEGLPKSPAPLQLDGARGIPFPVNAQLVDSAVSVEALPTSDQERESLKAAFSVATKSSRLITVIGSNSVLLSGGLLPRPLEENAPGEPRFVFTYYDYKKERAIEAYVFRNEVVEIKEREKGYQPPVTVEELRAAAGMVGPKMLLDLDLESLSGIAYAGPDGHRRVFVHGSTPERSTTATVEMADKRVLQLETIERPSK